MNTPALIPALLFLATLLIIGLWCGRRVSRAADFEREFMIGGGRLGGVVLAMTLVATYSSVSSFVSGPGVAWQLGYGWVVFAAPQIITGFLLLGMLGKRLAILGRRTGALTVIDILHARFQNRALSILLSLALLLFFTAMVVGQFIGGAQIFAAITGLDYAGGLILFALITALYTAAGFRSVALTDAVCAILMLTGMVMLGVVIISAGGGLEAINLTLADSAPPAHSGELPKLLSPNSGGSLSWPLLLSAWVLVGFGTLGLPQSQMRCLTYKSSGDLHRAMVLATIVCGALMIGMTMLGVLCRAVMPDLPEGGTDAVIPQFIVQRMHPVLAGLTVLAPLAATMSTVSSLLLIAASALLRDLPGQFAPRASSKRHVFSLRTSMGLTLLLGLVALVIALKPASIVVWVNMFAFGGLECSFLWPMVLGLFWPRMNGAGALTGVLAGLTVYLIFMISGVSFFGCHNIIPGLIAALLGSLLGTYLTPPSPPDVGRLFFPHRELN